LEVEGLSEQEEAVLELEFSPREASLDQRAQAQLEQLELEVDEALQGSSLRDLSCLACVPDEQVGG